MWENWNSAGFCKVMLKFSGNIFKIWLHYDDEPLEKSIDDGWFFTCNKICLFKCPSDFTWIHEDCGDSGAEWVCNKLYIPRNYIVMHMWLTFKWIAACLPLHEFSQDGHMLSLLFYSIRSLRPFLHLRNNGRSFPQQQRGEEDEEEQYNNET